MKSRWLVWLLVLAGLPACTTLPVAGEQVLIGPGMPEPMDAPSSTSYRAELCRGATSCARPHRLVGLALGGGGAKAAPFTMGVLEGLSASDSMRNVDYVSSVSGGSYAAFGYLSHVARLDREQMAAAEVDAESGASSQGLQPTSYFLDCIVPPPREERECRLATGAACQWCPTDSDNHRLADSDPFRFQNQIRAHQTFLIPEFDYRSTSQKQGLFALRARRKFGWTSVTWLPHHLLNSLFDWKVQWSPSRKAYNDNIYRAYGNRPCDLTVVDDPGCAPTGEARPSRDLPAPDPLTYGDLAQLYDRKASLSCDVDQPDRAACFAPYWVINATSDPGPSVPYDTFRNNTQDFIFEFTADGYGFGEGDRFRRKWCNGCDLAAPQPGYKVGQGVAASAAFFDITPAPQSMGRGSRQFYAFLQHSINIAWGQVLPNYTMTHREFVRGRAFHRVLPFPFYYLHRFGYGGGCNFKVECLYIRVSDGGRSDNTGAYSLYRRGVDALIIVDAASDPDAKFDDLCWWDGMLKKDGKRLIIEYNGTAFHSENSCERRRGIRSDANLRDLPPRLYGCIAPREAASCNMATDMPVHVLKPLLSRELWARLKEKKTCTAGADQLCELQTFANDNGEENPFPQHSTVRTTALSSPTIYGAYRELGKYAACMLRVTPQGDVMKVDESSRAMPSAEFDRCYSAFRSAPKVPATQVAAGTAR